MLVVDEAGMVGTRTIAPLMREAAMRRSKVVLVGDPKQLPEIQAGGVLASLAKRYPVLTLTENRRQNDETERWALDQLRSGDVDQAVGAPVSTAGWSPRRTPRPCAMPWSPTGGPTAAWEGRR